MKLKIRKIEKVATRDGKFDFRISMIWLYTEEWKWVKWVKLDDWILLTLNNNYINLWEI